MENALTDAQLARLMSAASSIRELCAAMSRATKTLGFERFIYAMQAEPIAGGRPQFVMTTYPPAWLGAYRMHAYADSDPILAHALRSSAALWWSELRSMNPSEIEHREEAKRHGLVEGVTVCANCRAARHSLLSLSTPNVLELDEDARVGLEARVQWFALRLHDKVLELINRKEGAPKALPRLTEKESACLRASATFLPVKSVALALGVSVRILKFHLANAAHKLDAPNRQAAVVKAASLGLINLTATVSASPDQWDVYIAPP